MSARGELRRIPGLGQMGIELCRTACPPHFHATYAISIFHNPTTIHCRSQRWNVGPGSVVVLEPREVHWGEPAAAGCMQAGLLPAAELMIELFGRSEPFALTRPVIENPVLAAAFVECIERADHGDRTLLAAALEALFAAHGTAVATLACDRERVEFAAQVAAALDRPIGALCATAGMSRAHYSRRFRRVMGISPIDFRRTLRVEAACALIENGLPLADAAHRVGFADQAHMTRQVRSILGTVPGALRRRRALAGRRSRAT